MIESETSPYGSTWYAATMVPTRERPALTHDIDVDVCVIGGGLAGLTIAREVARRGWSVAVLEAHHIAWNASGRNAGFVSPGFAERTDAIIDRVTLPRARELWALSEAGAEYIRRTITETGMPGTPIKDGRLSVRRTDNEEATIRHVAMLRVEFGAEAEAWPTDQVRDVLRSPYYFQGIHFPNGFHIHPLNYALGLAAAAEADGARIYQGTPATGLDPAGVRKRVQTPNAVVRAHHVVLAASSEIAPIDPDLAGTVLPISTYVAVTAPLGERLFDAVRYSGGVSDTRRAGDYYRVISDDRLMWGGRITTRLSEPRRLKALMRRDVLRVYPQLGDVEIEYAWSGTMTYAVHKMPQIGELAPGYWRASAFGGHGLNTTAMAGEMIARAILDGDDRWRLFSPYELVWSGGRMGRVAVQSAYWARQACDALEEKIARYRDQARRQSAEQQAKWAAEREQRRAEIAAQEAERRAAALHKAGHDAQRRKEEMRRKADEAARAAEAEIARRKAEEALQRATAAATALSEEMQQANAAAEAVPAQRAADPADARQPTKEGPLSWPVRVVGAEPGAKPADAPAADPVPSLTAQPASMRQAEAPLLDTRAVDVAPKPPEATPAPSTPQTTEGNPAAQQGKASRFKKRKAAPAEPSS